MNKNKKTVSLIKSPDGKSYLITFILVTSLFRLWGFAHGLLDVLNKYLQNILHVSKAQSGFVQFSLYIGYLVMAIPAGLISFGVSSPQLAARLSCAVGILIPRCLPRGVSFGGLIIFGAAETGETEKFDSLLTPYMLIGAVVVVVAIAFCPPIMGAIADHLKMAIGFLIPMFCFAFISYFGIIGYRKFLKEVS